MFFIDNKITNINEVYFGKTPSIKKIEDQLDMFRNKYMGKYVFNTHVNSDPDLLALNRMFEDQFGFGCFSLHIINEPIANAFTTPIDMKYDVLNTNKNLIANKKTFKFNKDADYACIVSIYSGVIFNPEFTTEEVMACILHEIGHNFYAALDSKHGIMINLFSALDLYVNLYRVFAKLDIYSAKHIVQNTHLFQKTYLKINEYLRSNNSIITIISDYVDTFSSVVNTAVNSIADFINMISLGSISLVISVFSTIGKVLNPIDQALFLPTLYTNERLADNFATMYGYGPASISLENKFNSNKTKSISDVKNTFNKIPVISNLYNINTSISRIILTAFDEHPDEISRCYDQLEMLEREARKNDIDPKMRKVLLADCKACRNKIDQMVNVRVSIKDKDLVRNAYNKALYNLTNSKALKDILLDDRNKFDIYDKTYNDKFSKED